MDGYVFDSFAPPPRVASALLRTGRLAPLLGCPHLDESSWRSLLAAVPPNWQGTYPYALTNNLTLGRVQRLLARLGSLDLEDRYASDVDLYSSFVLATEPALSRRTLKRVLDARRPYTCGALLVHASASTEDRLAAAPHAHPGRRAKWLATSEADALTDDQAWSVLSAPRTTEECVSGTAFDEDDTAAAVLYSALVLHLRPSLRARAVASNSQLLLLSAAHTELRGAEQEVLRHSLELSWHGPDADELLGFLSRSDYDSQGSLHPLALAAATPWATPETQAAALSSGVLLEADGALAVPDRLGYAREPRVLVPARARGTRDELLWKEVIEDYRWSRFGSPLVAVTLLASRDLSVRRAARDALWGQDHFTHALKARGSRPTAGKPRGQEPLTYKSPTRRETREPRELTSWGTPELEVSSWGMAPDRGVNYLEASLSDSELETAFTLWGGFTGTFRDLVEVSREV